MKNLLLALMLLGYGTCVRSQVLTIPYTSQPPAIDGQLSLAEWDTTARVAIPGPGNDSVAVYYAHDSTALYLAFLGRLESANARFPEAMLDLNHSRSNGWEADDWWFHVSATDCSSNGTPNDFSNCQLVQPDWEGVPNFDPGLPMTDTVEMRIPFATIGLDLAVTDTIGLALNTTNTFNAWDYWPATADVLSPATWGEAVFERPFVSSAHIRPFPALRLRAHPNPFQDRVTIRWWVENAGPGTLDITDLTGRKVRTLRYGWYAQGSQEFNWDGTDDKRQPLPAGTYVVRWQSEAAQGQALVIKH
ncbi:MAG: FlgD immunoglobulin-like domain containing protein [Bacteroidota bacterium]